MSSCGLAVLHSQTGCYETEQMSVHSTADLTWHACFAFESDKTLHKAGDCGWQQAPMLCIRHPLMSLLPLPLGFVHTTPSPGSTPLLLVNPTKAGQPFKTTWQSNAERIPAKGQIHWSTL